VSNGTEYVALSALQTRMDALDRIAADIANIGTPGYKAERQGLVSVASSDFGSTLQTAIQTTTGVRKLDTRAGVLAPTGRPLDLAIDGPGFFAVQTKAGIRYTRNGQFSRASDGTLVTEDGSAVQGANGPLVIGPGTVQVNEDGTVLAGGVPAGKISVVTFADPSALSREQASTLNANGQTPTPIATPIRSGSLEQSNVTVADRLADLTDLTRNFESLQKAISMLMNDVDGKMIDQLGKR
jgi:flagellar basal-body rod protein FlgF